MTTEGGLSHGRAISQRRNDAAFELELPVRSLSLRYETPGGQIENGAAANSSCKHRSGIGFFLRVFCLSLEFALENDLVAYLFLYLYRTLNFACNMCICQ